MSRRPNPLISLQDLNALLERPPSEILAYLYPLREPHQLPQVAVILDKALEKWGDEVFLLSRRGTVARLMGKMAEAEVFLRRAQRKFPENYTVNFDLALLLRDTGQFAEAEKILRQQRVARPNNIGILVSLAVLLRDTKRIVEAEGLFRRALKLDPQNISPMLGLGVLLRDRAKGEDRQEAETLLRAALKMKPREPVILNSLGTLLHDSGRFEEAEAFFQLSLDIAPGNSGGKNGMARLLEGKTENAEVAGTPTLPRVIKTRAKRRRQRNRLKHADL